MIEITSRAQLDEIKDRVEGAAMVSVDVVIALIAALEKAWGDIDEGSVPPEFLAWMAEWSDWESDE